ncbi:type II toxin-antitoxin system VapC family toxin [Methylobacterium sp. sgz302541]|uniref:type II toxin-antitoxin system VapC family toxin n=1 Tax=unclassified Methylobacterium TaxID=2615210 RepID=UPI003D34E4D4
MFVDASAIVAILVREPGYVELADCLRRAPAPTTSPLAIVESVLAIARIGSGSYRDVEATVRNFLAETGVVVVAVSDNDATGALDALARYGKGRGHPARLNLGDAFAYACAHSRDAPLLFVGNDFSQTDIRSAMA